MKRRIAFRPGSDFVSMMASLLIGVAMAAAQDEPTPSPTAAAPPTPAKQVRITFLPPPLEGTISLGIYDGAGKLVRVLHREAELDDFTIGNDALSTQWDGKNDAGQLCAPGKYHAHGFAVGDLDVEGRGYFFNDWITRDDSPRIRHLAGLKLCDDELLLEADLASGTSELLRYDRSQNLLTVAGPAACPDAPVLPSPAVAAALIDPITTVRGKDDTRWVIDRLEKGGAPTELKQFSASGDFIRRLGPPPGEPPPRALVASTKDDRIYLLEENETMQRVRVLSLVTTKNAADQTTVSEWKVELKKQLTAHRDFSVIGGQLVASPPADAKALPATVALRLQPNPLANDERAKVELIAGFDGRGTYLASADGLPLCTISETKNVVRALIAPSGGKALDIYQDDGAVVEQFRITGADAMMAFDCGEIQLK